MRAPRLPTTGVLFALGIAAMLACGAHTEEDSVQFRRSVVLCEEAVARLESCCPGFDGRGARCDYYYAYDDGNDCGQPHWTQTLPALGVLDSECILERSCETLVGDLICERAKDAHSVTQSHNTQRLRAPPDSMATGVCLGVEDQ